MPDLRHLPRAITVRGARANNLRSVDVEVPLWSMVMVTGVSGSGKSSLAMGVLYGEGSRRFLEGLSTYTRRRITQVARPDVDRIEHLPPALALRQRPALPGRRSTVGTMTETLNVLRLMFSRLGTHLCPNGHQVPPTLARSAGTRIDCPVCGVNFGYPSAESFSFNTLGACPACHGLGTRDELDDDALIPDSAKTLDEGAVAPWNLAGRSFMPKVAAELGVRTDVPFDRLTPAEQDLVLDGPEQEVNVVLTSKAGRAVRLDMRYENARRTVENAIAKSTSEVTRARLRRFFSTHTCSVCHGTRLRPEALRTTLGGLDLARVSALTLGEVADANARLPAELPAEVAPVTARLSGELAAALDPLLRLGLGHLELDRAGATLSTGERQRVELTSTLQSRSTGVLYVLDEPSVGLHPDNVDGLREVIRGLVGNGNSVVIVDHDLDLMRSADHLIEMGPGAGRLGGTVIAQGDVAALEADPASVTGPYLSGAQQVRVRLPHAESDSAISFTVKGIHTLHEVTARIPIGRLTAVVGVSGSGKTTLILESLVPALTRRLAGQALPSHVRDLDAAGIQRVVEVDSAPVGKNARSTPATYSGAFDPIRRLYAASTEARRRGWDAGHFSYNVKSGQCPVCEGLGEISLDIQYLPDMSVRCPSCHGARYNPRTLQVSVDGLTIAQVLGLTVAEAVEHFAGREPIVRPLRALEEVGLGYLGLGEPTPSLSGGEAQRMRLASGLHAAQAGTLYVFDEPSIGLHPRDVGTLLTVLDRLLRAGATVVVIDHDLDLVANADYVIEMGPGGGPDGGRIIGTGAPADLAADPASPTGRWLARR
ncbi:excinuclease ABC subunit UvrA [Nonomuraea sp. NBC_01738]|uniref:excinuclease ABC subunit UvrA n=1 Tax=Nonomuraea sp. NBC_01738 TaxID=2976003 RepID=UPI002E15B071|nr:excinuclease ABC subunit UvrA [Nonomuraea sp. NBC_01738]